MIYFIVIYGIVILLSFMDFSKKLHIWGSCLSVLSLSMLAGWRTMGGIDFEGYRSIYYGFYTAYFENEYGYIWLSNLFSSLSLSYNSFLFVYTLISISLLVVFLYKHTKFPSFALLFYMACYFFFYNMVLNRQMICMSIALWAIYEWGHNKWKSMFLITMGMLFHNSIFVIVPFLLIFDFLRKFSSTKKWIIFFSVFICFTILCSPVEVIDVLANLPGLSFIGNRLKNYLLKAETSTYALNVVEYIKMIIAFVIILPSIRTLIKNQESHIWLFFYFVGVILLIWIRNIEVLFRVFVYFDLSLLVILPLCLNILLKKFNSDQRKVILFGAYACMGVLAIFSILYRTHNFDNGIFWTYHFYFLG